MNAWMGRGDPLRQEISMAGIDGRYACVARCAMAAFASVEVNSRRVG
jgi:hypothetical protein